MDAGMFGTYRSLGRNIDSLGSERQRTLWTTPRRHP